MGKKLPGVGKPKKLAVVVVATKQIHWLSRALIALGVLAVLGGIAWALEIHFSNAHKAQLADENICSTTRSGQLLEQAITDLRSNDINKLSEVVNTIKGLSNYQMDPNCLYVITDYYTSKGDLSTATKYLTLFNRAYKKVGKINPILSNYETIANFQESIKSFQQAQQQANRNMSGWSGLIINKN